MAIAQGIAKKISFIKESTWGTVPANSSTWKYLRRVQSDFSVEKDTYQSGEIRTDYQIADFRHGGRRAVGSLNGELSPGTYASFMAAAVRKDFAAQNNISTGATTIAVGAPSNGISTLTLNSGDWYGAGYLVRLGHVLTATAGMTNNTNKRLLVVGWTSATVISVMGLNAASAPVSQSATGTNTVTFPGKITLAPTTGHTNDSFSVEQWYSDITQSEVYSGNRLNTMAINLPATGMATIDLAFLGKDLVARADLSGSPAATVQYSSSSSAATTSGLLTAVNGVLVVNGTPVGNVTGMTINYSGNASNVAVVGSNYSPDVFMGRINVTGQVQVLFQDATMRDLFLNEGTATIIVALAVDSTATTEFMTITLPRCKFGGATKNDGETGLSLTMPFQALLNSDGSAANGRENTTIMIHDSLAA